MDVKTLIEQAAKKYGTRAELARAMKKSPSRVSEWASGVQKPDAHEIAFMAECAGLPVLQTVAEIEAQLDERYASIWREALGKLTAAGVTAAVLMAPALLPNDANARQLSASSLYIMSTNEWRGERPTTQPFGMAIAAPGL
jgi:transcriptional regulator with XRE-family HTH domain